MGSADPVDLVGRLDRVDRVDRVDRDLDADIPGRRLASAAFVVEFGSFPRREFVEVFHWVKRQFGEVDAG